MTITRSVDIDKDDTSILIKKKNLFPQKLQYSFNRGNSNSGIIYRSVYDAKTLNDKT